MTPTEITRLAGSIASLRPDWPQSSLHTFITRDLAAKPYRDAAVAMVWVASDPDTQTPRRVLENGPWWQAVADPSQRGATPDNTAGHRCDTCTNWVVRGEEHICQPPLNREETRAAADAARAAHHAALRGEET